MATSNSESQVGDQPTTTSAQDLQVEKEKLKISFDLCGNPLGPNKPKFKTRCLKLSKSVVGLMHDNWKKVPDALKDDLWNSLMLDFDLKPMHKENVLSRASGQWKGWKKNLRKRVFGNRASTQEIVALRDQVPLGEPIPLAEWNVFIDRESAPKKLEQRAKNKANRAKKKDVHLLGAKSYAQVATEWQERTKNTEFEGLDPNRVNMYLHARTNKEGAFHPNFVDTAAKIKDIKKTQGETSAMDIGTDPVSQVVGKDKKGRIRGVGSQVSSTKYKATRVAASEIDEMKSEMKDHSSKMDSIINLLQKSNSRHTDNPLPMSSTSQNVTKQSVAVENSSSLPTTNESSPIKAYKGFYHIRDLKDEKNIAMAKIETVEPGTIVHTRKMKCPEAKLSVLSVYPNMANEPVYLNQQGCADTMGEFEGSYIVWPVYLLKEMV